MLGRFGGDYKERFLNEREADAELGFNNIVENRIAVAHLGAGAPNLTFEELKASYRDGIGVLVAIASVLGVDEDSQ